MKDEMRFVASWPGAVPKNPQLPALDAPRAAQGRRVPAAVPSAGQEFEQVLALHATPRWGSETPPHPESSSGGGPSGALRIPTAPGATGVTRPAELARCILLSRDVELAHSLASIAVGAGVQLLSVREVAAAAEHRDEVILVGQDAVAEIGTRLAGAQLILTGTEQYQDVLWRAAATSPGARVAVLPQATAWLGEYLGELGLHGGRAHITVVAGARGGAGTSTFAALLAATATLEGQRTLLLDADPHSPGIWSVLRSREPEGLGWEDLENSRGQLSPGQLAEILPLAAGTAVLSWIRDPGCFVPSDALLTEVLAASRRIYERIVVDAGHIGSVPSSMAALANTRLLLLGASAPNAAGIGQRLGEHAGDWRLILTGKLPSGIDARALAQQAGITPGGYFGPRRDIGRAAAQGVLMNVLARHSLRRSVAQLGQGPNAARPSGANLEAGQAA